MAEVSDDEADHDRQARAVTDAIAKLSVRFAGTFSPGAIFEGAVKGAAVVLLEAGASTENVAELLDDMAAAFRDLDRPQIKLAVDNSGRPH